MWRWLWRPRDRRIMELEKQVEALKLDLEMLGMCHENLRQWLLANTAAAAGLAKTFGGPIDKEVRG